MTALNITERCYVRLHDGSIHGPLVRDQNEVWRWKCGASLWTKEGRYWRDRLSDWDIAEVMPAQVFPPAIPAARKSAHVTDGVTIPAGATNLALEPGGVLSWDEPVGVVTMWGRSGDYNGSRKWAFDMYHAADDTHRLDLHTLDDEIVAAIPSRIKEDEK